MSAKINRLTDIGPFIPEEDDDLIICRCEEVTKGEIRRAIHDGMWTHRDKGISDREWGCVRDRLVDTVR